MFDECQRNQNRKIVGHKTSQKTIQVCVKLIILIPFTQHKVIVIRYMKNDCSFEAYNGFLRYVNVNIIHVASINWNSCV